jgi:2-phosphosulfolactate phosphatase
MSKTVAIARYPSFGEESVRSVIVAVDVIRATTTAVTAVTAGRRCFPVPTIEAAVPLAGRLENPLLVGELGGNKPYGFHLQNSPVEMDRRVGLDRPVILLSTSGTKLMCDSAARGRAYAACLRNARAQAEYLASEHQRVLLLGGETRGEFRDEDRLCCARIARDLLRSGFQAGDAFTEELVKRWGDAPDDCIVDGHSAKYLAATGQSHDLEFVLDHIDDLHAVFELRGGELVMSDSL